MDRTELRWIPAHQGVRGNEIAADRQVKEAALDPQEQHTSNNWHFQFAAAAKRHNRREAKSEWEYSWAAEKTGQPTKRLVELTTKKTLKYWSDMRKATASNLTQLRIGRIGLAARLNRIS